MGRVKFSDSEHYGGGGGGSFFSLKNDKDVARVRFMFESPQDMDDFSFAVHRTKMGGEDKYRSVSCLRSYNEPVDNCPFCAEFANVAFKFFIPLYNVDAGEVQIWERGKNFAAKMASLMSRYGTNTPLVNHVFEIERNGAKGDMKTTYEIYEVDKDETMLEDLPEIPEILGNVYLLDRSFDDMNYYLDTGEFPPQDSADDMPVRRRGSQDEFMNPPDDEELPFEEEPRQERGNRARTGRRASTDNNTRRRTPAGSNGAGNGRRNRAF